MLRPFLTLTLAAALLAPLAATAQTTPAAPATPTAPAAPKPNNHVGGKISSVDAVNKTVTITHHKKDTTLTLSSDAKIYKVGDAKGSPTGTFADLAVGTMINAHVTGDASAPTATEIHIRAPKTPGTAVTPPAATPAPATP